MATFTNASGPDGIRFNHQFTFINHSNSPIEYDLGPATDGEYADVKGNVDRRDQVDTQNMDNGGPLEQGNVPVVMLPNALKPGFWFHSSGADQYINLLGGDGWTETKDTEEISELTGNGFRVTVDGGGVNNPKVSDIFVQVYNA